MVVFSKNLYKTLHHKYTDTSKNCVVVVLFYTILQKVLITLSNNEKCL